MSASATAGIKRYLVRPAALGTFVGMNETPAIQLQLRYLLHNGVDMNPDILTFDRKVCVRHRTGRSCCWSLELMQAFVVARRSLREILHCLYPEAHTKAGSFAGGNQGGGV